MILGNQIDVPIDAVVAFNDEMALGVNQALREHMPNMPYPHLIGVDALSGENGGIEAIQNGDISASFIYPSGAEVVIDVAKRILNRSAFDRRYMLNTALVNIDNVRILSLQREEMDNNLKRLESFSESLNTISDINILQKRASTALIILVIIILLFLLKVLSLNKRSQKMNTTLNEQNVKINDQVETLKEQNTKLVDLAKQLEDATQEKMMFFTNISHEFKTPLTLILGSIELLSESNISSEQRHSLSMISKNSNKLLALINEILEFRVYENNQMKVNYSRINIKSFMEDINVLFMDITKAKRIKFNFTYDLDKTDIHIDPNKYEKIYFNILSNAFKFVKDEGIINVRFSKADNDSNVLLSIFNSDSYIPEGTRKEIFTRFYKMNPMDGNSTGIGLALTKSLVDALEGTINVDSDINSGTTITVELPLKEIDDQFPLENYDYQFSKQSSALNESLLIPELQIDFASKDKSGTILVIEDSKDMLEYLYSLLNADYRFLYATNGKDGITKANNFAPDLIICDIMMPVMNGYEVCEVLKSNDKTKAIPIILLTACSFDDQRVQGYDAGADAFIQKPFSANLLKTRIRSLISKAPSQQDSMAYSWLVGNNKPVPSEGCDILDKIVAHVTEHINESISVDDLANALGLSKSSMYKKIKEATDFSPIDLINQIKIKKAIDLVVNQHRNLTEAAYEVGYNSMSYFSRVFSKYYKISPKKWLKDRYDIGNIKES